MLTAERKTVAGRTRRTQSAKPGYMPTLDGWRAIAILSVILNHSRRCVIGPVGTGWFYSYGNRGVDLFFAISGLLICSRLLEEERVFGRISLRNFYIRRAFRILPPAVFMLFVAGGLALAGIFRLTLREWLGALFFFHNYAFLLGPAGPDSVLIGHFWSLAVEEHFYLILPALLVLTRKGWRLPVLAGLTLLLEIHLIQVLRTRDWNHVLFHTGVHLGSLMIPAILAVVVQAESVRARMKKWLRAWPILLIAVVPIVTYGGTWQILATSTLLPLMILGSVLNSQGILVRVLEWSPLRYIGRISYSVYLWQELFFTGHYHAGASPLGFLERFPWQYFATFAIAIASYHLLERPMIRLGHRFGPPATPGRGDIAEDSKPAVLAAPGQPLVAGK